MGFREDLDRFRASVHQLSPDGRIKQSNCTLHFISTGNESPETPSESYVPIVETASSATFDIESFKSELATSKLGRVVILY